MTDFESASRLDHVGEKKKEKRRRERKKGVGRENAKETRFEGPRASRSEGRNGAR